MASNTVEAVLQSKFEDGISKAVNATQATLAHASGNIQNAGATMAAGIAGLWDVSVGRVDRLAVPTI